MFSGSSAKKTGASELVEVPNFRVFTSSGDTAAYGAPLENVESETSYLPILLVSIMSGFYQNRETLQYIMQSVHDKYPALQIPIVNLCGDTVYRTTEHCLFTPGGRDPVQKGRDSWKKKYDEVIAGFRRKSDRVNEVAVYWDTVKEISSYSEIKKITDVIFNSSPSLTVLRAQFTGKDDTILEQLLIDIEQIEVEKSVHLISDEFMKKNFSKLRKLDKQEKEKKKRSAEAAKIVAAVAAMVAPHIANSGLSVPEEKKQEGTNVGGEHHFTELLKATRNYLAEEFAVFMTLSLLQGMTDVLDRLKLRTLFFSAYEGKLRPVLHYPIDSTKGSDVIFTTFRKVENLYIKYCDQLSLPKIAAPVTIVDVFVPDSLRPHKSAHGSSQENSDDELESGSVLRDASLRSASAFFHPTKVDSSPKTVGKVMETAEKILDMIVAHIRFRAKVASDEMNPKTVIRHKNGVNCNIEVERNAAARTETDMISDVRKLEDESDAARDRIKEFLVSAILSIASSDCEIETDFQCAGFAVKITMSLPASDIELTHGDTRTTFNVLGAK